MRTIPICSSPQITDDEIMSIWRTVRPSAKQDAAMTYVSGQYDVPCPTWELRRLVELAIESASDAARWRYFASSPQTAILLGSRLDPNDTKVDWVSECNRLADAQMPNADLTGQQKPGKEVTNV